MAVTTISQKGTRGAYNLLFFLLCMTWMHAGVFLWFGGQLLPAMPSIVQTFVFLALSVFVLFKRVNWLSWFGQWIESVPLLWIAIVAVVYALFFRFGHVRLLVNPLLILPAGVFFGLALLCWQKKYKAFGIIALSIVILILAVVSLQRLDLGAHGDQLLLVEKANQIFATNQYPYAFDYVETGTRLTYFPGLWLIYLPLVWSGLDPRWMNVLFLIALELLIFVPIVYSRLDEKVFWMAIGNGVAFVLNPGTIDLIMHLHVAPEILAFALIALGFALRVPLLASIGFAFALAVRQTTFVWLPLFLLSFVAVFRGGYRYLVSGGLLIAALIGFAILPDPASFLRSTLDVTSQHIAIHPNLDQILGGQLSLAAPFVAYHIESVILPIQFVLIGFFTLFWWRRGLDKTAHVLGAFISVYGIFLLLNPVIWAYYWLGYLLLMLFLVQSYVGAFALRNHSQNIFS